MSKKFVEYLNSMNSVGGHSINSLAESQIINEFYKEIHVDRKIATFIKESILKNEHRVFIITGHAGDGKTSILAQVLKDLNLIENRLLEKFETVEKDEMKVFYVKDMSELNQEKQEELILEAIRLSKEKTNSIIISNTGPLLKTVKKIDPERESDILEQLDINRDEEIELNGSKITIINLARIENIKFVDEIVENVINKKLWNECEKCEKGRYCHICGNIELITKYKSRFIMFLKAYYRWLSEYDKRLTIRQMMAHITYAITANKKCESIKEIKNNEMYYKHIYNISNNLFGFNGIKRKEEARQIRAIDILQSIEIDKIALDSDYELFIKNDFSMLPEEIKKIVEMRWNSFEIESRTITELDEIENKAKKIRRCIRRYYLLFGEYQNENKVNDIINEIFGEKFTLYNECVLENSKEKREIKKCVFTALSIINTGFTDNNNLYLTLGSRKNNKKNSMVVCGELQSREIDIELINTATIFDDVSIKNDIYIVKKRDNKNRFKLSYQLLDYFNSVNNGAIDTKASPMITCGIDKLNAWLLKTFKETEDEQEIKLLVRTNSSSKIKTMRIDEKDKVIEIEEW